MNIPPADAAPLPPRNARPRPRTSLVEDARLARRLHLPEAQAASALFRSWCDHKLRGVPGLDTTTRLALRIYYGRTPENAAAREYIYRWSLALKSPVFDAPHTLGL